MGRKHTPWAIALLLGLLALWWAWPGAEEEEPAAATAGAGPTAARAPTSPPTAREEAPADPDLRGSCLCLVDGAGAPLSAATVRIPVGEETDTGSPREEAVTGRDGCLPVDSLPLADAPRMVVPGLTRAGSQLDLAGTAADDPACRHTSVSRWVPACPSRVCLDTSALGPEVTYEQLAWSPEGGGLLHEVPLDEAQCARIPDLGCGTLGIRLDEPDGRPRLEQLQVDGPGEQTLVLTGDRYATVRIHDADGAPVAGALVACSGAVVEAFDAETFVVRGTQDLVPCHAGTFGQGATGFMLGLDGQEESVALKPYDTLPVVVRGIELPATARLELACEGLACRAEGPGAFTCPCPRGRLQLESVDQGPLGITDRRLQHSGTHEGPGPVVVDLRKDGRIDWRWLGPGDCRFDLYGPTGSRHGACADGDAGSFDGLRRGRWTLVLRELDDSARGEATLELLEDPEAFIELGPGDVLVPVSP